MKFKNRIPLRTQVAPFETRRNVDLESVDKGIVRNHRRSIYWIDTVFFLTLVCVSCLLPASAVYRNLLDAIVDDGWWLYVFHGLSDCYGGRSNHCSALRRHFGFREFRHRALLSGGPEAPPATRKNSTDIQLYFTFKPAPEWKAQVDDAMVVLRSLTREELRALNLKMWPHYMPRLHQMMIYS